MNLTASFAVCSRSSFNFVWDSITSLEFKGPKGKDTDVPSSVRRRLIERTDPRRLQSLQILAANLTNDDSLAISSRWNLRELTLRWKDKHSWGLDNVTQNLTRLTLLDITGSGIRYHLAHLAHLKTLNKLCLHEMDRVAMDLSPLKTLPIETIHIEVPLAEELEQLALFGTLKHLVLRRRGTITAALDVILEKTSNLSQVHTLRLGENGGTVTLRMDSSRLLSKLENLYILHLTGIAFTTDSWSPIVEISRLKSLQLRKCEIPVIAVPLISPR